MKKIFIYFITCNGSLCSCCYQSNGMDRSCEATIYLVLDKPRNSVGLGPRGHPLKEICPLVFKISFTIRLDRR
jgi:hypothetical protein